MDRVQGSKSARFLELDGLRGLAALSVVLYHYTYMFNQYFSNRSKPAFSFSRGNLGVELFFIISGFVILMTVSKAKTILDFLVSRLSRIYPVYWVAIFFTFTILTIFGTWPTGEPSKSAVLFNFTMLQRFFSIKAVDGVYWSLQYELLFYALILGAFILGLIRRVELICITMLAASLAYWVCLQANVFSSLGPAGSLIKQAWLLAIILGDAEFFVTGMMLYRIREKGSSSTRLAVIAGAIGMSFLVDGWVIGFAHTAFAILVGLAIAGRLPVLSSRPMVFLGAISYPLYLVHQYAGYVLIDKLEAAGVNPNVAIMATIATAVAGATVLSTTIERPATKVIRAWYSQYKAAKAQEASNLNTNQTLRESVSVRS
jgi:peptidoglycan/LPS O-acetylase OafA/YrhL